MAKLTANIASVDALRQIRAALLIFQDDLNRALMHLELEGRRPMNWLEANRIPYWQQEYRKATNAVNETRVTLDRCMLATSTEDERSCYDERKAFEKAKRRLRLAEEKIELVKKWKGLLKKEVEEFLGHINRVKLFLDQDIVGAVSELERMTAALDQYLARSVSPAATDNPTPQNNDAPEPPHSSG